MSVGSMLADEPVFMTGAGGGIGRDITLAAAREGARELSTRSAPAVRRGQQSRPAQSVIVEIRGLGGEAVAIRDSIGQPSMAGRITLSVSLPLSRSFSLHRPTLADQADFGGHLCRAGHPGAAGNEIKRLAGILREL